MTIFRIILMVAWASMFQVDAATFVNGDFESLAHTGTTTVPVGGTGPTGWTIVGSGNVDWVGTDTKLWNLTSFLDLTGTTGGAGIQQTFDGLIAGGSYSVNFDAMNGSSVYSTVGPWSAPAFSVAVNGETAQEYTIAPGATRSLTYTFTALSGLNTVTFSELSGKDSNAGWIDNISITPVPEPWQYGLIGVFGMIAVGIQHRFSRKSA